MFLVLTTPVGHFTTSFNLFVYSFIRIEKETP